MFTLAQWKTARRLDHIHIGKLNIRYRGNPDAALKAFDTQVAAYHAATNFHDRVGALGEIIRLADLFGAGVHANNTYAPVQTLDQRARLQLQQILAPTRVNHHTMCQQLTSAPHALAQKTVTINCFIACALGSEGANYNAVDLLIDTHVQAANQVFLAAGARLTVLRNPAQHGGAAISCIDPHRGATFNNLILNPRGRAYPGMSAKRDDDIIVRQLEGKRDLFGDYGRAVLSTYFNTNPIGPGHSIDVVYVPEFDQDGVQGVTTRPSSNGITVLPNRPFIAINRVQKSATTYPTTLCHELIHALIDNGDHSAVAANLLADGGTRGVLNQLTWGQICAIRSNPSAV